MANHLFIRRLVAGKLVDASMIDLLLKMLSDGATRNPEEQPWQVFKEIIGEFM